MDNDLESQHILNDDDPDQNFTKNQKQDSEGYEQDANYRDDVQSEFFSIYNSSELGELKENPQPTQEELQKFQAQYYELYPNLPLNLVVKKLYKFIVRGKIVKLPQKKIISTPFNESFSDIMSNVGVSYKDIKHRLTNKKKINSSQEPIEKRQKQKIHKLVDQKIILTNHGLVLKKDEYESRYSKIKTKNQYRFFQREIAAKAFCDRGYGIPLLREQIFQSKVNISMQLPQLLSDDKRYKAVSCAFVTQAFRRLERFLIEDCKKNIRAMNSTQLKVMYTILLNCRQNFSEAEARTFVKFVKIVYELGEVEIQQEQTTNLYTSFMHSLRSKVNQLKYDPQRGKLAPLKQSRGIGIVDTRPDPKKIWNREREIQFYNEYLKERSIGKVRDNFRSRYSLRPSVAEGQGQKMPVFVQGTKSKHKISHLQFPNQIEISFYRAITDMKVLLSKFHQSIRGGLRRVQLFVQSHPREVPRLKHANDDTVKAMFGSPDAVKLREIIFLILRSQKMDVDIVYRAVKIINEFVITRDEKRKKAEEEEEEIDYLDY